MGSIGLPICPSLLECEGTRVVAQNTQLVPEYGTAMESIKCAKFRLQSMPTIASANVYSVGPLLSYGGKSVFTVG
jgi:hypothetical protein